MTLVIVLAYVGLSVGIALLGRDRKFGYWGYMFASLLLTPIIGMLLYLATDGPMRKKEPEG